MSYNLPILVYLRIVLDEHTTPLANPGAGFIESTWLIAMIHKVEAAYREYGTI